MNKKKSMVGIGRGGVLCGLLLGAVMFGWTSDELPLTIETAAYPHMEAIRNGAIKIPECRISYSTYSMSDLSQRFEQDAVGDVIEVDIFSALGHFFDAPTKNWIFVPVYLWREFPHHHVRQKGDHLTVDAPGKSLQAWAVGILKSSPTFKPIDSWELEVSSVATALPGFYEDARTAEENYFRETRIFPIMTVLAVRAELVAANPWLPEALFIAFSEAKSQALETGTLPLPWGETYREETIELMHKNFWSYGVRNNPKTLEALLTYAFEQGITQEKLNPDDVFAPETLQLIDEKGAKN